MAEQNIADIYSPEPNILESRAADYLARSGDGGAGGLADGEDRRRVEGIRRTTRWAIWLSVVAGVISGGIIGGSEAWIRLALFDGEEVGWLEAWDVWIWFFVFAGVISAIEIGFLYYLALRGAVRITHLSGLELGTKGYQDLFARGLARGALEFPNPQTRIYGIDPYAHVSNWRLIALNVAYKLKVGVTSFLLRVFMRRVAARMAIRGFVPLVAGPLYAVWNAYIIWRIMTEARIRTRGPLAVDRLMASIEMPEVDKEATVMLHGAGEMLTRGKDAHPNQFYLMFQLGEALERDAEIELDWEGQREHFEALDQEAQGRVLDVLTLAAILGSRVYQAQKDLLQEACTACYLQFRPEVLRDLRNRLKRGHRIEPQHLADARSPMHARS